MGFLDAFKTKSSSEWCNDGIALNYKGKYIEAINCFENALKIDEILRR